MKFFSLSNLSGAAVEILEKPWEFEPKGRVPYPTSTHTKDEFTAWCQHPTTEHAFLSAFEGMSSLVRVSDGSDGNHVFQMHGVIADYDSKAPDALREHIMNSPPSAFLPQWLVTTARGNSRLVWFFERPVMLSSPDLTKKFLAAINKELKLSKWAAGMDVDAYANPQLYYEIGKHWEPLFPKKFISSALLELWLIKAADKTKLDDKKTLKYMIPMEDLSAEMHRKYPNRWPTNLYIGARGVRFWDPSADNPTAAVVFEDGMYCFTGTRAFMTWEDIFGKEFVSKYEAQYVENALVDTAYDGRSYYVLEGSEWLPWSKEDFAQSLRCKGYDGSRARGKTHSEIDLIEHTIKQTRRVERALPFLYYPSGIITYDGHKYMNTARVSVCKPAVAYHDGPMYNLADGKDRFPFLYKFLLSLFSKDEDPQDPQLIAFLAWLKYFYQTSYTGKPGPGHALVLAGEAGKGKTFLNRAVLGGLMAGGIPGAGYADASDHLVDGSQWTDQIAHKPIMAIDDAVATEDFRELRKFTQRIKKYTANSSINYNAKWAATGQVPWFGRILITCNLDPESLRILPDMDQTTRDKIMLFRTSPVKVRFRAWHDMHDLLVKELPYLARFLLEWPMPEDRIATEARFGVKPYHDKSLFEEALHQSADGNTTEVINSFLASYFEENKDAEYWEGAATILFEDMSDMFEGVMRSIKKRQLSTCLGKLKKSGYSLEKLRIKGINVWRIQRKFLDEQQDGIQETGNE